MPILTGKDKKERKKSLNSRLGENGCRGKYIISENADLAKREKYRRSLFPHCIPQKVLCTEVGRKRQRERATENVKEKQ